MTKLQQSERKTLFIEEFYPLVAFLVRKGCKQRCIRPEPQRGGYCLGDMGGTNIREILAERLLERGKGRLCKSNCSHGVAFNQKMVDVHRLRINQSIKGRALLAECLF